MIPQSVNIGMFNVVCTQCVPHARRLLVGFDSCACRARAPSRSVKTELSTKHSNIVTGLLGLVANAVSERGNKIVRDYKEVITNVSVLDHRMTLLHVRAAALSPPRARNFQPHTCVCSLAFECAVG